MKTIIIDLDGVCFDPTERLKRCRKEDGTIDWNRGFLNEEVIQDTVIHSAVNAVQEIAQQFEIFYLTGRSYKCEKATRTALWLKNDFPSGWLSMRVEGDTRPDDEIKKEKIEMTRSGFYEGVTSHTEIIAAIDDDYNGKLKPMYESLGIPCFTSFHQFWESEVWKT